jgi:hypothetical protein
MLSKFLTAGSVLGLILAFFLIFAGPPVYICLAMDYPYYVYEVIQATWATLVLAIGFIIIEVF